MNLNSIDRAALLLLHQESLEEIGEDAGPCDEVLLDAALAYPLHLAALEAVDIAAIAAAYATGILKYRPFLLCNERAALLALGLFLYSNEWRLNAPQEDAVRVITDLSAGRVDEADLADWICAYL
ncbi:MAG TPA: type II toxin-antitoxin system death-on-curing family toxin [Noviherbaspirillum sp.]|uniref:type II toxin-antitoxin system death-on-curing family toxin n=1 Tax=Noviherbaspirillum sp. TaxID=1926288 RepID=UPI002B46611F|nr:type II toxin-antitoxin system death-on-curing family toxin [Noviherbaspirillum sp.]HJV84911.1 type II toxin-antitoxin system death-on-curing family toxin [Noviherbaspirillum sp.]